MFSPATYQSRRRQLISQLDSGLILFLGNQPSPINYPAQHYPFRQDSSFLYFFGIDRPGLVGLIDVDTGEGSLYGDDATLDDMVWTGPQSSLEELAQKSGLSHASPVSTLDTAIADARSQGRPIHFLPPYRHANLLRLTEWLDLSAAAVKAQPSVPLIKAIVAQRSIKSDEEVAELHLAAALTGRMHRRAMQQAKPGLLEAEVMAQVYAEALTNQLPPSFSIICSVRGEVLHNETFENHIQDGQLLLVDAGGQSLMHYAGDMTRTLPVSGTFTSQQREVYEIVLQALQTAEAMLRPGLPYREAHLQASQVLVSGLIDLGIMKGDPAEAVAAGAHALFFPHGLGHMLGLDVHDMEDLGEDYVGYTEQLTRSKQFGLRSLRLGRALEAGFCLTVEPGLYFIPGLIDQWKADGIGSDFINFDRLDAYREFGGIRLENDYVITSDGANLLGDPVPLTPSEVEAEMAK